MRFSCILGPDPIRSLLLWNALCAKFQLCLCVSYWWSENYWETYRILLAWIISFSTQSVIFVLFLIILCHKNTPCYVIIRDILFWFWICLAIFRCKNLEIREMIKVFRELKILRNLQNPTCTNHLIFNTVCRLCVISNHTLS